MRRSIELLTQLAAQESGVVRERLSSLIASIQHQEQTIQSYARQATRIGEMETELIDEKIAARTEGLVADGGGVAGAIAAIESHVEAVLRPSRFATMLEQIAAELEDEIAERKLTAEAKAVLQSTYSMSEEQAHSHLRTISRKSRRPLREVALELIQARNSSWLNLL